MESVGSIPTRAFFAAFFGLGETVGRVSTCLSSGGGWKSEDYWAGLVEHDDGESGKTMC